MRHYFLAITLGIFMALGSNSVTHAADEDVPVSIAIDAEKSLGPLIPAWRFFGYDECNFTYMKDGQALLSELGQFGADQVYVRCHHLLTSGDGTPGMKWGSTGVYREDADGRAIYDWTIVDRIFDTYLKAGVKPYVQIGFMPKDLSTRPDLYPVEVSLNKRVDEGAGQAYPPKDYGKWGELVYQWARHCIDRYGKTEVQNWYWEVWNEPDILYWRGTQEEYNELYDYAVDGVRRALPTARVGGNEAATGAKGLRPFLEHCVHGTNYVTGKIGSPLDFIAFHAKGSPRFVDGHVQMGIAAQLSQIDRAFEAIASFEELKGKPIVIGEADPDGMAARPVSEAPGLGYRDTSQFPAYTAACFAREYELAAKHGVNLEGALTWSFEFENKPYFAGYRVLASNGIDLPILNVFRMFGKMGGNRVQLTSSCEAGLENTVGKGVRDGKSEVYGIAAVGKNRAAVLIYNYSDDDVAGVGAAVTLALTNLPGDGEAKLTTYRIDETNSNAHTAWTKMGSPAELSAEQYAALVNAGQLAMVDEGKSVRISEGKAELKMGLARQSVVLEVLEWK